MKHIRQDYQDAFPTDPRGKIAEDEPVMLFRAQDRWAPVVLTTYARLVHAENPELAELAMKQAGKMIQWQAVHGKKTPDMPDQQQFPMDAPMCESVDDKLFDTACFIAGNGGYTIVNDCELCPAAHCAKRDTGDACPDKVAVNVTPANPDAKLVACDDDSTPCDEPCVTIKEGRYDIACDNCAHTGAR